MVRGRLAAILLAALAAVALSTDTPTARHSAREAAKKETADAATPHDRDSEETEKEKTEKATTHDSDRRSSKEVAAPHDRDTEKTEKTEPAASHGSERHSSEEAKSEDDVGNAAATYDSAVDRSAHAIRELERFVGDLPEGQAVAEHIENQITEAKSEEAADAKRKLRQHLHALKKLTLNSSASLSNTSKEAQRAAQALDELDHERVEALQRALRRERKEKQEQARTLGREARQAARAALKAARALERTQRRSRVSEAVYEGDFGRHEHITEHMEDVAGDLPQDAQDAIAKLFDAAGKVVEGRYRQAAKRRHEEVSNATRAAKERLRSDSAAGASPKAKTDDRTADAQQEVAAGLMAQSEAASASAWFSSLCLLIVLVPAAVVSSFALPRATMHRGLWPGTWRSTREQPLLG